MIDAKQQLILLQLCGYTYKERQQWLIQLQETPTLACLDWVEFVKVMSRLNPTKTPNLRLQMDELSQVVEDLAARCMSVFDSTYPELWRHIPQPPHQVYYSGRLELIQKPLISLIGNRRMSDYGKAVVQDLVPVLIQQGWVCVSGLAVGIDTAVHVCANQQGEANNIGIIATGIERTYPLINQDLQQYMRQNQLVLSEFLPNQTALKHHFIMRNRLVAGIAPITILIESAERGGSLITANYAIQYNRELYAVPGRIYDKQSVGCNQLIASGANMLMHINQTLTDMAEIMALHYRK